MSCRLVRRCGEKAKCQHRQLRAAFKALSRRCPCPCTSPCRSVFAGCRGRMVTQPASICIDSSWHRYACRRASRAQLTAVINRFIICIAPRVRERGMIEDCLKRRHCHQKKRYRVEGLLLPLQRWLAPFHTAIASTLPRASILHTPIQFPPLPLLRDPRAASPP